MSTCGVGQTLVHRSQLLARSTTGRHPATGASGTRHVDVGGERRRERCAPRPARPATFVPRPASGAPIRTSGPVAAAAATTVPPVARTPTTSARSSGTSEAERRPRRRAGADDATGRGDEPGAGELGQVGGRLGRRRRGRARSPSTHRDPVRRPPRPTRPARRSVTRIAQLAGQARARPSRSRPTGSALDPARGRRPGRRTRAASPVLDAGGVARPRPRAVCAAAAHHDVVDVEQRRAEHQPAGERHRRECAPATTRARSRRRPWARATATRRSPQPRVDRAAGPVVGGGAGRPRTLIACRSRARPRTDVRSSGSSVDAGGLAAPAPAPSAMSSRTSSAVAPGVGLEEVGVLGRDDRAADPEPLEPGGVDEPAGGVAGRVAEHRAGVGAAGLVLAPPAHDLGDRAPRTPRPGRRP